MHWQLATEVRDVNAQDNSAFTMNACGREGNGTQVIKKITCKSCKPQAASPRTPTQVANLLYQRALAANATEDTWATIACNGCTGCADVDTSMFEFDAQWVSIGKIISLLGHVAYDHAFGTEIDFVLHTTPFSVYELNFAVGKPAQTEQEDRWRAEHRPSPVKELA